MSKIHKRFQIAELFKSGMMYRKALEQLPHRMFIKGVNHAYVFCNEAFAQDLNIKPDEISGKSDYDFFSKEQAEKMFTGENEILSSGVKKQVEEKYVFSGKELTVLATKSPVRNDNGDIIGMQAVMWDITEDKRRTENLENLLVQRESENKALIIDLEKIAVQRNQLEAEIKHMQEDMKKQMAIRGAERERVKNDLKQETVKRNDAGERPQSLYKFSCELAVVKSSEIIVKEMLDFIQREGGHPKTWLVGLTNDPRQRLFDEHQVHYQNDAWIYRTAASESEAQQVHANFLEFGMSEGSGVLRSGSRMVYAYRKSIRTKP